MPNFILNSIGCPVLLTGSLKDVVASGIAQEFARISGIVPDCDVYPASESGHRYGEEHPLMWMAPETFQQVADLFLTGTAPAV